MNKLWYLIVFIPLVGNTQIGLTLRQVSYLAAPATKTPTVLSLAVQSEPSPPATLISAFTLNGRRLSEERKATADRPLRTGIQWTEGLSWQEVKDKAKRENKYIFLDCYTTWCGPCKRMDKDVYGNDSVGDYFNQNFICVKVQMDKTTKDDELVKRWYNDAATIGKQYRIESYPCFLFLSPQSQLVHQATGYTEVAKFVVLAQTAIKPGKMYEDPYAKYDSLVKDYQKGIINYDMIVYMIKIARKFDTSLSRHLVEVYSDYISSLNVHKRYTKNNIEFWSLDVLKSNTTTFQLFYKDGRQIDRVMQQKGYAAAIVDKTIYYELVVPFFIKQNTNPALQMTGMYTQNTKPNYCEADWKQLKKIICRQFNKSVAKRNVLAARIEWYRRHWNVGGVTKFTLMQLKKYPPDLSKRFFDLNNLSWEVFLQVTDKKVLHGYINLMEKLVKRFPRSAVMLDTYANLLYKVGRKDDAIEWEKKALREATEKRHVELYKKALEQMMRAEPTYGVRCEWML